MAKRPTPSTAELIEALSSSVMHPFGVMESGEVAAISWNAATYLIHSRFHTTHRKASDWLLERATEPSGELVIMRPHGGLLVTRSKDGEYHASVLPDGWSADVGDMVSFNRYGRPVLAGSRDSRHNGNMVLLRSSLPTLLDAAQAAREAERTKREEEERATRREFYGHHSEAMTVIEAWLTRLDRSGVHEALRDNDLLRLSNIGDTRLWGAPGGLTIELHGSEIAAFATLIEQTRKGQA